MKRKLKAASLKGTPPITKYFKRNSDIKAKPLAAVVAIESLSKASPVKRELFESQNNKFMEKAELSNKKLLEKSATGNENLCETNVSCGKNVEDLVPVLGDFNTSKELGDSLPTNGAEMEEKSCLCNGDEPNQFSDKKERNIENASLASEEKTENGCLNNIKDSKLSKSEHKTTTTELGKDLVKHCDHTNERQFNSSFDIDHMATPVTSGKCLAKDGVSCEKKRIVTTPREKTKLNESPAQNEELCSKTSSYNSAVRTLFATDSKGICPGGNVEDEQVKSLSAQETSSFQEASSSQETVKSQKFSSVEADVQVGFETEPSYEMEKERTSDVDTCSASKADVENSNIKKMLDLEVDRKHADHEVKDGDLPLEEHSENRKDDCDSSDDELLSPVAFLYQHPRKLEIRTPEKAGSPICGSPLTPIRPFVPEAKNVTRHSKYALEELLLEKPKQIEREKVLAELQQAMQHTIKLGRCAGIAEDDGEEREDDENSLLPIHRKKLEEFKSVEKGVDATQGLNVFPGLKEPVLHRTGCSQPFSPVLSAGLDEFTKFMYEQSDVGIRELLCSDWVTHEYLVNPWSQGAVRWLFHVLCYHVDTHTVKASYSTLWSILNSLHDKENRDDLSWLPCMRDVVQVFNNYGANFNSLLSTACQCVNIGENLLEVANERDPSTDTQEESEPRFFPLANIYSLIQFVTLCLDHYPGMYSTQDLEHFALLLYCVSLDTRVEIRHHDIKTCLQAIYDAVEPSSWIDEATKISTVICRIETNHRNKLRIIQIQPYSSRGHDVKKLAALKVLGSIVNMSTFESSNIFLQSDPSMNKENGNTSTIKLFTKLEMLLREVRVNDDTDYYELYTVVELVDICVGAEFSKPSPEKPILERLTKKLRSLHGDIKDPKAMFMSRTKVKDVILRTVAKFQYMAQGNQRSLSSQKTITKFFVEGKSDLRIELLKDSEAIVDEEEEEEVISQESFLSQNTVEFSDGESLPEDLT